jgi:hypothetical protein
MQYVFPFLHNFDRLIPCVFIIASANLFLKEKIDVVDLQRHELAVWAIQVEQKTTERNKDRPREK